MDKIFKKLTAYRIALAEADKGHSVANERTVITSHLSAAVKMYTFLSEEGIKSNFIDLVKTEIRNHGWSFISDPFGAKIANTWVDFVNEIEKHYPKIRH